MRALKSFSRRLALLSAVFVPLAVFALLAFLALPDDLDRTLSDGARRLPLAGLPPSLRETVTTIYRLEGGSRLSRRLAGMLISPRTRGMRRWVQSLLLRLKYSEGELLCHYLSRAPMGSTHGVPIRGFAQAAQAYFGLPYTRLTVGECAILGHLAFHPQNGTPLTRPAETLDRRDQLLRRLRDAGVLSQADYEAESARPLSLAADPVPIN